ncbi:MarR family winged helix-turn-helix transcriptional regulator [Variovorax sp.]|uniref:MarR family winged helix-turn-helix transcriptional regulator n=1 Tax=Variovorax sp. TaxID=1871043 RepID=UPI002D42627A|nr:MarR family winged helix-turn-helix transcriptional regulator [Variovorax sp.]HYP82714.1 MarR family winged helix-turn-helix transcriptional regulator [Variovorax sp.]
MKDSSKRLQMEDYVPYQLALLSSRLSAALEEVCKREFDIVSTEWRVMALVGQVDSCSASELVEASTMDAVAIHRAVKRLDALGYLSRSAAEHDLRVRLLSLTAEGRKVYRTIVPYAIELQHQLLQGLAKEDALRFKVTLTQLAREKVDFDLGARK